MAKLRHAQDALEREMEVSQRDNASKWEEVNLGSETEQKIVQITKVVDLNVK